MTASISTKPTKAWKPCRRARTGSTESEKGAAHDARLLGRTSSSSGGWPSYASLSVRVTRASARASLARGSKGERQWGGFLCWEERRHRDSLELPSSLEGASEGGELWGG